MRLCTFCKTGNDMTFQQKLRCKELAESYAKSHSDETSTVFLDRSGFSAQRNSCVASTSRAFLADSWDYEVVDVVTGDTLYHENCSGNQTSSTWCGNGSNIRMMQKRDKVFDEFVK